MQAKAETETETRVTVTLGGATPLAIQLTAAELDAFMDGTDELGRILAAAVTVRSSAHANKSAEDFLLPRP